MDFSAATCARALPLLEQASEAWAKVPPGQRGDAYVMLQRARCEITEGSPTAAATHLRALVDSPDAQKEPLLLGNAYLVLADLYAAGQGVPADPERALALYLLATPQTAEEKRHRDRSAAELFRRLRSGLVSPEFYRLLERGGAPSNWLLASQAHAQANDNRYDITRLELRGILDANPYLVQSDPKEAQALRTLEERAGVGLMQWDSSHFPAAIVLLRRAGTPASAQALATLVRELPYRLVMPSGTDWGANHATR